MDFLTELWKDAGLERRMFDQRWLTADHALRFPCERSLGFHVVLEGAVYLHSQALPEPLRLEAGDIAVMGRGCTHLLSTHVSPDALPVENIPTDAGRRLVLTSGAKRVEEGEVDGGARVGASMMSGAYQLWNTPVHPFFAELPTWHVLRAAHGAGLDPLGLTVAMLADEARRDDMGRDSVVQGLLDVLFTYLLRELVAKGAEGGVGWRHALQDPHVRKAVASMHAEPARAWTLESLAAMAGLSRSVLALRFRDTMGDTPLAYLRVVRLQRAMRLLLEDDSTLEQVANAVGYHDAFGFSKAFKRAVGVSPGEYRRRDAADREVPWRFNSDRRVTR